MDAKLDQQSPGVSGVLSAFEARCHHPQTTSICVAAFSDGLVPLFIFACQGG